MLDPRFFLATVVSNEDPALRGRVRIRIMGVHTEITQPADDMVIGIAEKDLPFAQCMYPVTYTGTGGTCPPPSLQPGDWVLGISLDGPTYQNLMVLGLAKAKFNAEALADGSLNANDAFSSVKAPILESEAARTADAKAEAQEKYAAKTAESNLQKYNAERGPEYETAAKIADDWKNNSGLTSGASTSTNIVGYGAGSSGSSGMVSTGNAVFNILSSLSNSGSPFLDTFRDESGLRLNTNASSDTVKDIIEEGYYSYCYKYFNDNYTNKSPALPTYAFNLGCGLVDELLEAYGDPRNSSISYAQFYNNMKNDGKVEEAAYFNEVVSVLKKDGKTGINLSDKNLSKFKNHQYRLSSQIPNASFRLLGTVVFPTLRSTLTQNQQMLPYYSIEGDKPHEHIGIDLASIEIPVLAMADGTVQSVMTTNPKDCNSVVILHKGGIKTLYMHMNNVTLKKGDVVKAGQQIGIAGGAGSKGKDTHSVHLHFAIKKETKIIDPYSFLTKDLGFAINAYSSADYYRRGPLKKTDTMYNDLQKNRNSDNIAWSF